MLDSPGGKNSRGSSSLYKIHEYTSLKALHTFGLPAVARYFCEIDNEQSLIAVLKSPEFIDYPHFFLGEGSNTLFTHDYPGIVIRLNTRGIEILFENNESICLRVGAGENWHKFIQFTLEQGYCGLENLSLIPGSVGASPVQNIGAYGVEVKDFITRIDAIDIQSGEKRIFENAECNFSYRDSCFKAELKNRYVITAVSFRLKKRPQLMLDYAGLREGLKAKGLASPTPLDVSTLICSLRKAKLPDPNKIGNAGSFFKNPILSASHYSVLQKNHPEIKSFKLKNNQYKIPAAWLIEYCGFKGKYIGSVGIYEKQALVLINRGQASGKDVHLAIRQITEKVSRVFNITLDVEPILF